MDTSSEWLDSGEAELIRRAQRGDPAAWEELVSRYQAAVFRIAYLILADADSAEDVAQETFLRAYRALHRFDLSRPIRPWLLQISANQSRNLRRSLGRYWNSLQKAAREEGTRAAPSHQRDVERRWDHEELWNAIRKLPAGDQEIIYLRYFMEVPVSEAAMALDIAEGTVKSRLSRALERLSGIIGRDFPALMESRGQ